MTAPCSNRCWLNSRAIFDKETGILLEQIRLLRAQLFGRKSEKIKPGSSVQPLFLFDMPEPEIKEEIHVLPITAGNAGESLFPGNCPGLKSSMTLMTLKKYAAVN